MCSVCASLNKLITHQISCIAIYGNMTDAEKKTAEKLVKANAVNLNAELGKVHFVNVMEALEEVLV